MIPISPLIFHPLVPLLKEMMRNGNFVQFTRGEEYFAVDPFSHFVDPGKDSGGDK